MNLYFNRNLIETETYKAYLIKMPKKSPLRGWKMWYPKSLIREDYSDVLNMYIPDSFELRVIKSGQTQEVSREIVVDSLQTFDYTPRDDESYFLKQEPNEVEYGDIQVKEELLR